MDGLYAPQCDTYSLERAAFAPLSIPPALSSPALVSPCLVCALTPSDGLTHILAELIISRVTRKTCDEARQAAVQPVLNTVSDSEDPSRRCPFGLSIPALTCHSIPLLHLFLLPPCRIRLRSTLHSARPGDVNTRPPSRATRS